MKDLTLHFIFQPEEKSVSYIGDAVTDKVSKQN